MALAFARIWRQHSTDAINDFFRLSKDAEDNRKREYEAAAIIQRHWRGYVCRTYFSSLTSLALRLQKTIRGYRGRLKAAEIAIDLSRKRRFRFYNGMATKIQRVWRGYISRKHKFDFYARKRYIAQVSAKQKTAFAAQQILLLEEKLDKAAGFRHHLVGTQAVPGVFARVRTASAVRQPDAIDEMGRLDPMAKIPESKLRDNQELQEWLESHVGKNPRRVRIKPVETPELSDQERVKLAQGPFLPKYRLLRKTLKPLRPTLRVQTDFYDTRTYAREERRKDIAMRVSQHPFVTGRGEHKADCFLTGEPYIPKEISTFRKPDPSKQLDFKNVLPPLRLFDELS
ncbi:hypothetical protein BC831DRAFT_449110 [Entophlyctis helioformis]|nr:hypothetical protein BC831DRAFT_449110 [Entophlyctis helioformis]